MRKLLQTTRHDELYGKAKSERKKYFLIFQAILRFSARMAVGEQCYTGRLPRVAVGIANRGDSRGTRRVQRREVVLLGLRCRIPARMHLLSRRGDGGGGGFFPRRDRLIPWATENGADYR